MQRRDAPGQRGVAGIDRGSIPVVETLGRRSNRRRGRCSPSSRALEGGSARGRFPRPSADGDPAEDRDDHEHLQARDRCVPEKVACRRFRATPLSAGVDRIMIAASSWSWSPSPSAGSAPAPRPRPRPRIGRAILSGPAALLEPAHDHHPAALRQRLGRLLGLSRHTTTVKNDASAPAGPTPPPGTPPARSHSRCALARGPRSGCRRSSRLPRSWSCPFLYWPGGLPCPLEPGDGGHRGIPPGHQGQATEPAWCSAPDAPCEQM
jgi:hypothetical protein